MKLLFAKEFGEEIDLDVLDKYSFAKKSDTSVEDVRRCEAIFEGIFQSYLYAFAL